MLLTTATVFDYLLGLGERHPALGRSQLTFDGAPSGEQSYPLLLVEGDTQGQDVFQGNVPTGLESVTVAVHVLTKPERTDLRPGQVAALLADTKAWAQQLIEQVRLERPGQLLGVGWLSLPGNAGSALATGWRVELTLKLVKDIDRTAPAAFTPEA